MDILADLNKRDNITVLVSLHQVEYAMRYCPRTIALRAGKIVYDGPSSALTPQFLNSLYGAESEDLFLAPIEPFAAQVQVVNGHLAAIEQQRAAVNGARHLNA
jgi:phosphonate transport system ATP-binding protein